MADNAAGEARKQKDVVILENLENVFVPKKDWDSVFSIHEEGPQLSYSGVA